jgi:hypothetical protein
MIRRFNYTGRVKIVRGDAQVTVNVPGQGAPTFTVDVGFADYRLPATAQVYIEAYRHTSLMRFDWGTVADCRGRNGSELTEFGTAEGVKFRVKVVEPSGDPSNGRPAQLLAIADRLSPRRVVESVEQAESLLPVDFADIEEVWRLQFDQDDAEGPILQVNRRLVSDRQALVRSEQFATLVLPQVFRQVLERAILVEDGAGTDDAEDWRMQWLAMAKRLPGVGPLPPSDDDHRDDTEDWIDNCVGAFFRAFKCGQRFADWWTGEEEA